jgi:GNAT superfamily N-acetyltransferase
VEKQDIELLFGSRNLPDEDEDETILTSSDGHVPLDDDALSLLGKYSFPDHKGRPGLEGGSLPRSAGTDLWGGNGVIYDKYHTRYDVLHDHRNRTFYISRPGSEDLLKRGVSSGSATMSRDYKTVSSIGIQPEFRRKGLASALYRHIEEFLGRKLEPNWALTPEGEAFWKNRKYAFDPNKHPRRPSGSERGGEFAPAEGFHASSGGYPATAKGPEDYLDADTVAQRIRKLGLRRGPLQRVGLGRSVYFTLTEKNAHAYAKTFKEKAHRDSYFIVSFTIPKSSKSKVHRDIVDALDPAFKNRNPWRVEADIPPENIKSIKMYSRSGKFLKNYADDITDGQIFWTAVPVPLNGSDYWGAYAEFDPTKHPRHPGGSAEGGEFSGKGELYHVTYTKKVPQIKKKGLLRFQTSNWVQAGNKERYGAGEIYAFEHLDDAIRWASKMDWSFNREVGSGKISIIKFKNAGEWETDPGDPISQAGAMGKWVKSQSAVKPGQIVSSEPLTSEMAKEWTARQNARLKKSSDWQEGKHPRHPAGSEAGGEFSSKGIAGMREPWEMTLAEFQDYKLPVAKEGNIIGYHKLSDPAHLESILKEGLLTSKKKAGGQGPSGVMWAMVRVIGWLLSQGE